ncbi:MAG: HAD-IIA family hydrolase [Candidatus Micrarchaeota archaeon]|nr:HAD-IIA family hydrolase [Candidatus Micrarchaeota archaeon]
MIKAVVFDLDGVVYVGKHAIPGVPQEIARLQKKLPVFFLTNNATKSRKQYVLHLASFGIRTQQSNIMTSSFGCAKYLLDNFGTKKKVFVIGEEGLKSELASVAQAKITSSSDAKFLVCGLDRAISYEKLRNALLCLNKGAHFILANNDPTWPTEKGLAPGSGAIGALLSYASGRAPDVIIGKPSTYLLEMLLKSHNISPSDAIFVGDRLDIDIRMANKAGLKSVLVLSGVSKKEDIASAPPSDKPNIVLKTAAHLGSALGL